MTRVGSGELHRAGDAFFDKIAEKMLQQRNDEDFPALPSNNNTSRPSETNNAANDGGKKKKKQVVMKWG